MLQTNTPGPDRSSPTPQILLPLPDKGFCPTEACIPWKECHSHGWQVTISTERGIQPQADRNKLYGPLPGLVSAGAEAKAAHQLMIQDPSFHHPIPYAEIDPQQYDAILLPGGDALPMAQYLESSLLQGKVLQFWQLAKLVGAICHGVLVLARTIDPATGHSVIYGRKVAAPPRSLDLLAYRMDSWLVRHGYIMYPQCVADEVRACLQKPEDLFTASILRQYAVVDGNLVTSRWYLEAGIFATRFAKELQIRLDLGTTQKNPV
jgi:putative intracellular protease/amidase